VRVRRRPEIAIIHRCAFEYLKGNSEFIEATYEHWADLDMDAVRGRNPNPSPDKQALLDFMEKVKESITGESETGIGGLDSFKNRVKAYAADPKNGDMLPIPKTGKDPR
jgi:hypothetical protein